MAALHPRPLIFPLSNPTSKVRASVHTRPSHREGGGGQPPLGSQWGEVCVYPKRGGWQRHPASQLWVFWVDCLRCLTVTFPDQFDWAEARPRRRVCPAAPQAECTFQEAVEATDGRVLPTPRPQSVASALYPPAKDRNRGRREGGGEGAPLRPHHLPTTSPPTALSEGGRGRRVPPFASGSPFPPLTWKGVATPPVNCLGGCKQCKPRPHFCLHDARHHCRSFASPTNQPWAWGRCCTRPRRTTPTPGTPAPPRGQRAMPPPPWGL